MKSVLFQLIFVYHFCGVQLRCPFQEVFLVSNSSVQFRSLIRPKKKLQSVSEHARLVLCYFHHFYLIVILRLWNQHCTCAQAPPNICTKKFPHHIFQIFCHQCCQAQHFSDPSGSARSHAFLQYNHNQWKKTYEAYMGMGFPEINAY